MDSRGARGGETEAVDRRGQDYARYAKVTSDGKKGHKRKANVNRCHICEDIVPPVRDYIVPRGGRAGAREVPTQEGRRTPDARHSE